MLRFVAIAAILFVSACGGPTDVSGPTCTALQSFSELQEDDTVRALGGPATIESAMQSIIADVMTAPSTSASRAPFAAPKNILAISTGGQNGAFSSGFLAGWTEAGTRPSFDIVTGASAGALVAPVAFVGSNFDQHLRRNTGIGESDVFSRRGTLRALWSNSLFDTAPLERRLENLYNDGEFWDALTEQTTENRLLLIGATELESGRFRRFDFARLLLADKGIPDKKKCLVEATLASAAIPGLFPPRRINGSLFVDAGVRQSIFLDEIIEELDRGRGGRARADVYLLINGSLDFQPAEVDLSLLPLVNRNIEILTDEGMRASILRVLDRAQFRGWTLRAAAIQITPDCGSETAPDGEAPVFSRCVTEALYEHGRELALSDKPWLNAEELRAALEAGRISR
ncbi:MAG: patatin-like phospholipase family protein [Pseudomonadota bacterium]